MIWNPRSRRCFWYVSVTCEICKVGVVPKVSCTVYGWFPGGLPAWRSTFRYCRIWFWLDPFCHRTHPESRHESNQQPVYKHLDLGGGHHGVEEAVFDSRRVQRLGIRKQTSPAWSREEAHVRSETVHPRDDMEVTSNGMFPMTFNLTGEMEKAFTC